MFVEHNNINNPSAVLCVDVYLNVYYFWCSSLNLVKCVFVRNVLYVWLMRLRRCKCNVGPIFVHGNKSGKRSKKLTAWKTWGRSAECISVCCELMSTTTGCDSGESAWTLASNEEENYIQAQVDIWVEERWILFYSELSDCLLNTYRNGASYSVSVGLF